MKLLVLCLTLVVVCALAAGCRNVKTEEKAAGLMKASTSDDSEPGRKGIERAIDELYKKAKDWRFAAPSGGSARPPIAEFEVYRSTEEPAHWHYVTYGLSELGEKESDDPEVSGWGIELTMRVKAGDEEQPPAWPMHVLNRLAEYVWESGNPFAANHVMRVNGLPVKDTNSKISSVAFVADPELGTIETSNGKLLFLQAYGITTDEEDLVARWDVEKFLAEIGSGNRRWVTELERESHIKDPVLGPKFEEAAKRDGSQRAVELITTLEIELSVGEKGACDIVWAVDPADREILARALRYRLAYTRELQLISSKPALEIVFSPADSFTLKCDDKALRVGVPAYEANTLADKIAALNGELAIPILGHRFVLKPYSPPDSAK